MKGFISLRFIPLVVLCTATAWCAPTAIYQPNYRPLSSGSWVQDKNFYVLTLLEQIPACRSALVGNPALEAIRQAKTRDETTIDFAAIVAGIGFTDQEIEFARSALIQRFPRSPALQALVEDHLRPSGRYSQSANKTDAELLGEAWVESARGINRVIRQFVLGKSDNKIDSSSYDPSTPGYQKMILAAIGASTKAARTTKDALFFEPSLDFALRVLAINRRDEPARHEPLAEGENRAAMEAARHIDWTGFKYASLLVHGIGPDEPGIAISNGSHENCATAAGFYHAGLAPVIIVSGGYVHPKQTIFCEAIEMKKELVLVYGIPESAILIEPQARHTTTNIRNGVRLLLAAGAPLAKPSLSVAQKQHMDHIVAAEFQKYCREHFGVRFGPRTSDHTIEFLPATECMQTGEDPLDP